MIGRRFSLFRLFGFEVRADLGWVAIALFVAWSLAYGAFPALYPGLSTGIYWAMGIGGALGLFASILLHEISHAAVARRYGLETRWITLWIFGGIAETVAEPPTAPIELRVAVAGPVCSLALAAVGVVLGYGGARLGVPEAITGVLLYLGWINLLLALFNLLPGFPLDGGRVLRAILWQRGGDVNRATRAATGAGIAIGLLLMATGVVFAVGGNFIGGLWWILIGSFLRRAAESSMDQLVIRKVLEDVPVYRIMDRHPLVVPPGLSLDRFVQEYAYARGRMRFPVVRDGALVGFLDVADVRGIPPGQWPFRTVDDLVRRLTPDVLISPEATGAEALKRLQDGGAGTLLVSEGDRLEGVVSFDDVARSISVRTALEGRKRLAWLRPAERRT